MSEMIKLHSNKNTLKGFRSLSSNTAWLLAVALAPRTHRINSHNTLSIMSLSLEKFPIHDAPMMLLGG